MNERAQVHRALFGYKPIKITIGSTTLISKSKKVKKLTPWTHTFVCLADVDCDMVPSNYSLLSANGLIRSIKAEFA